MTKEEVVKIQNRLMVLGYALPKFGADGVIGAETMNALAFFQTDNNLKSTGTLDQETYDKLFPNEPNKVKSIISKNEPSFMEKGMEYFNNNRMALYGFVGLSLVGVWYWKNNQKSRSASRRKKRK